MNKKLGKILLLSITTLCLSVGAVLGLTKTNVTVQAEDAYTVTNIEDFIGNNASKVAFQQTGNRPSVTEKDGNFIYNAAYPDLTTKQTEYNEYAGNMQVQYTNSHPANAVTFNQANAETVMSFRTVFGLGDAHGNAKNNTTFMCRTAAGPTADWPNSTSGYAFRFFADEWNRTFAVSRFNTAGGNTTECNGTLLGNEQTITSSVALGQDVIITYGSYTNDDSNVVLLFKMDKINDNGTTTNVINYEYVDDSELKLADSTHVHMGIHFRGTRLILGGIDEPIFSGAGYTYTESVTAGTKLSTVSVLGYTWTDANATIKAGTHAYSATYNYFGKSVSTQVLLTAEYSYDVTKIEDVIDGKTSNFRLFTNGAIVPVAENNGNYIYNADNASLTTAQTDYNAYAGNMQVELVSTHPGKGIELVGTNAETVVSLRMKYGADTFKSMSFMCRTSPLYDYNCFVAGYNFRLVADSVQLGRRSLNYSSYNPAEETGTYLTSATYSGLTVGDDVIVTYGSFTDGATGNVVLIFKMDKVNADGTTTNVVNCSYEDSSAAKLTEYGRMMIASGATRMILGGVDTPIFYDHADKSYTVAGVTTLTAGVTSPLSTVTLNEGYAWVNGSEALKEGTFAYDAIYTYADLYYGKYPTQACKVTVSAREPSYAVVLLDETGTVTTATEYVHVGDSYTLVDDGTVGLLGWYIGEELYPVGYTFTPNADCSIKRVSLNMVVTEGAAIRYATNNGKYGLTFEVKVNKAQYDALKAANVIADFNGYICPVDLLGAGFTQNAVVDIKAATMTEVDGYYVVRYTLTNILNSNINRKFAGQAYVVVNYANDTTANVFADYNEGKHARSVLERAKDALEKHNNAVATGTMDGLLNAHALSVVTSYVNSVAEIAVNAQGVGTVVETEAGDSIEREYTLVSYEETANGNEVNVTLKLDYSDVELYEPAENDKINLPVTLYVLSGGEYVELRIVTPTVVWDGKSVTLTFSYVKED